MYSVIKGYCEKRGMSVAKLESELGFGNCTIVKWEHSSPSVDRLKKVADYFGVTVDRLLAERKD